MDSTSHDCTALGNRMPSRQLLFVHAALYMHQIAAQEEKLAQLSKGAILVTAEERDAVIKVLPAAVPTSN